MHIDIGNDIRLLAVTLHVICLSPI